MSDVKTPADVVAMMKSEGVQMVDLRFMDFPGIWQHFSVPAREIDEDAFVEGLGFDGSSIRGWQAINESDMLVKPVADSAFIDPFMAAKTLVLTCNIADPITGEDYTRDPRNIARKAEAYLQSSGVGDVVYFGPEAEFFIFDDIRFDQNEHEGYYFLDSVEGRWNSGRVESPNLGYKPRYKEGYFPVPPTDSLQDIRSEIVLLMESIGIPVEAQHHEVATGGQCEIDMRFAPLVQMADNLLKYKYIAKNVARRHNKTVTYMPKPVWNDNGKWYARAHVDLERRKEPLLRRSVRGSQRDRDVRDRGTPEACAGSSRPYQSDDEQLQATRPGLRGTGQSRLQQPKPLRRGPNPHVLEE